MKVSDVILHLLLSLRHVLRRAWPSFTLWQLQPRLFLRRRIISSFSSLVRSGPRELHWRDMCIDQERYRERHLSAWPLLSRWILVAAGMSARHEYVRSRSVECGRVSALQQGLLLPALRNSAGDAPMSVGILLSERHVEPHVERHIAVSEGQLMSSR